MMDLISREEAIEAIKRAIWDKYTAKDAIDAVCNVPSAQERKMGKWKWSFADNGWADWTCSVCGYVKNTDIHVKLGWRYCPWCGAEMVNSDE